MKFSPQVTIKLAEMASHAPPDFDENISPSNPVFAAGCVSALRWVLSIANKEPNVDLTDGQIAALQVALDNNKLRWAEIHGTTQKWMIAKGLVGLVGLYPNVTEHGLAIAHEYELHRSVDAVVIPSNARDEVVVRPSIPRPKAHSPNTPTTIKLTTKAQVMGLQAAMDHDRDAWSDLNGYTITSLGRHELCVMYDLYPALTPKGEIVAAEYGITKSANYVEIPENLHPVEIVKRAHWTKAQIEAFRAVMNGDKKKWLSLVEKTRITMVKFGWVTVCDETPVITDFGKAMAIMNKIETEGHH